MNDQTKHLLCPACYAKNINIFYEIKNVPVHSVLVCRTKEEALNFRRGDIALGFCFHCGFIFNTKYDEKLQNYSTACEESQNYSSLFNEFSLKMAKELVGRYKLYRKNIIEIGCGKGDFLLLICEIGENTGVGFDPAFVPGRLHGKSLAAITFIQDFYGEKYAHYQADFVCCKMTLEHIPKAFDFIKSIKQALKTNIHSTVFFQVPDATRIVSSVAFEDIYYEHCSYFSPGSLARLFRRQGFELMDLRNEYAGQYLVIESRPGFGSALQPPFTLEDDLPVLYKYIKEFPAKFLGKKTHWEHKLLHYHREKKRCLLWGSGSKAVSFLTTLNVPECINFIVDINPYRQGTFMPGTGQLIVAPDFLAEYRPDVVIIMNPIYYYEVKEKLKSLAINPEIVSL